MEADYHQRGTTVRGKESQPPNSPYIFSLGFLTTLIAQLEPTAGEKEKEELRVLREKLQKRQGAILNDFRNLTHQPDIGNSMFATYHFAAAVITSDLKSSSPEMSQAVSVLKAQREYSKKEYGSALIIPYNLRGQNRPKKDDHGDLPDKVPTLRSSAARGVPFHLAVYLRDSKDNRLANADYLMQSLSNYDDHFYDIFSGIGESRTHDRDDSDEIAPYYGPASLPFVFSAVALLKKQGDLNAEKKAGLEKLEARLLEKSLSLFENNGLFRAQAVDPYRSAVHYDNTLIGLALLAGAAGKKGCEGSSLGILPDPPKGTADDPTSTDATHR
jgi:hypothetical protein